MLSKLKLNLPTLCYANFTGSWHFMQLAVKFLNSYLIELNTGQMGKPYNALSVSYSYAKRQENICAMNFNYVI